MKSRFAPALALAAVLTTLSPSIAAAQSNVLVSGLKNPEKIVLTDRGNLLVAEEGTGPNTGRISIVDRSGNRRTLIDNLPAGLAPPNGDPDGPTGLALRGMTLFISIGNGDTSLAGPNGTETPNPNPSSPLFSSVLELDLTRFIDSTAGNFSLTSANQTDLKNGQTVTLTGGGGETATIRVFADFPDYVSDPITNVRVSHPFGLFLSTHNLFVVDAAMNSLRRIDLATRQTATVAAFAPLPNPTSVGPPVMDAVPDSVRLYGNRLLVPFLPGFPFPPGSSLIRSVDPATGNQQTLLSGLTSAIDVLPVSSGGPDQFLVLEFSTDMNAGKPGQLLLIPSGPPPPGVPPQIVVAPVLPAATSLAFDRRTSEIFVSQLANGQITRINAASLIPPVSSAAGIVPVVASTQGLLGSRFQTFVELHNPYGAPIAGTLVFHALGVPGSSADPTLNYSLLPYETVDYPDFLGALGQTGVGSLDVFPTTGAAPLVEARVYGDTGGFDAGAGEELVSADDALLPGQGGTLLVPPGLATKRFNIGIRTLGSGASLTVTIRDRSGAVRRSFAVSYPADYFAQFAATDFLGVAPQAGDSIRFTVSGGRAVVYGATVDNATQKTEIVLATRTAD